MKKIQILFNTKIDISKPMFACIAEELICYCNYFFHKNIEKCTIEKTFEKNISFCTIHKGRTLYHLYYNEISSVGSTIIHKKLIGKYHINTLLKIAKKCSKIKEYEQ